VSEADLYLMPRVVAMIVLGIIAAIAAPSLRARRRSE
jgi:hypothetical protein